jgi:hypothetical protein
MTKPLSYNEFSPADIHAMDVTSDNACAAAAGAYVSEDVRGRLAEKMVSYALANERDATVLYLKCLKEVGLA